MKAYLRRVFFSAAALFLLMALVAPVISGTDTAECISSGSTVPSTPYIEEPQLYEPVSEPERPEDPISEEEENKSYNEPEEISSVMPQEDEDPASSQIACQVYNHGKSNPRGQGFLRNLLRKAW